MWKLLLVGLNYLASLLDTCIFRPGWLSNQDTILYMLEGSEPENQELKNQHWTSSNPQRLWQRIKQIKSCWHVRLSEERYREKDSAWHQLIDGLFGRRCESGIEFRLPCWKVILNKMPRLWVQTTTCMSMEMPAAGGSQQVRCFHFTEIWK